MSTGKEGEAGLGILAMPFIAAAYLAIGIAGGIGWTINKATELAGQAYLTVKVTSELNDVLNGIDSQVLESMNAEAKTNLAKEAAIIQSEMEAAYAKAMMPINGFTEKINTTELTLEQGIDELTSALLSFGNTYSTAVSDMEKKLEKILINAMTSAQESFKESETTLQSAISLTKTVKREDRIAEVIAKEFSAVLDKATTSLTEKYNPGLLERIGLGKEYSSLIETRQRITELISKDMNQATYAIIAYNISHSAALEIRAKVLVEELKVKELLAADTVTLLKDSMTNTIRKAKIPSTSGRDIELDYDLRAYSVDKKGYDDLRQRITSSYEKISKGDLSLEQIDAEISLLKQYNDEFLVIAENAGVNAQVSNELYLKFVQSATALKKMNYIPTKPEVMEKIKQYLEKPTEKSLVELDAIVFDVIHAGTSDLNLRVTITPRYAVGVYGPDEKPDVIIRFDSLTGTHIPSNVREELEKALSIQLVEKEKPGEVVSKSRTEYKRTRTDSRYDIKKRN